MYKLNYDSSKECSIKKRSDYSQLQACSDSKATMYYSKDIQPCQWF